MNAPKSEASVGDLLNSLARDTGALVRQEVQLAATEIGVKAERARRDTSLVALGGALAQAGLLALMLATAVALEQVIPMWLSGLVLGLVFMGTGYALVQKGISSLQHFDPTPSRTLGTLGANSGWPKKEQAR